LFSSLLSLHVKVGRIVLARRLKSLLVRDDQAAYQQEGQVIFPEILQHPVHVDGREPEGVPELILGYRQFTAIVLNKPDGLEPHMEFKRR
jgi:hypothetical protein